MFGLVQHGDEIEFRPCLPAEWDEAEMTLRRAGKSLRILFSRADDAAPAAAPGILGLQPGERLRWSALPAEATCRIVLAPPTPPVEAPSQEPDVAATDSAAMALRP
jgi:cyclic beta-1,2-glucan synthetase